MKKSRADVRGKTATAAHRQPEINEEEEQILRKATIHLIRNEGGLFVATDVREETSEAGPRWIISVTLRYPTGHEDYVGDLLFDGDTFTFLTEKSLIDERVRQISEDPEGVRKWHEYRNSTLPPGKA